MSDEFYIPSEEELQEKERLERPPVGTIAVVTAVPNGEGVIVAKYQNRSGKGDRIVIQFRIAEGEYEGGRASLTLFTPHKESQAWQIRQFKDLGAQITGKDVSSGAMFTFDDIVEAFQTQSFKVELDLEERPGKNGAPLKFTTVKSIIESVARQTIEMPAIENNSSQIAAAPVANDDDIPF